MRHAFLDHHSKTESPVHPLDARTKILLFFPFMLGGVSSAPISLLPFGFLAMGLIGISRLARLPLGL